MQSPCYFYQLVFSLLAKHSELAAVQPKSFAEIVRAFEQGTQLESTVRTLCAQAFAEARAQQTTAEEYARALAKEYNKRPHVLGTALLALLELSVEDGSITAQLDRKVERIAQLFGFSKAEYQKMRSHFVQREVVLPSQSKASSVSTASEVELLRLLGCGVDATDNEIRTAYRRQVLRNHPDVYASLALDEEVRIHLAKSFQQIQAAYLALRQMRGMR